MASQIIPVADKLVIRFKDRPFHLKNLYKMIFAWLRDEGYATEKEMEKFYYESRGPAGSEIWWWWRTDKNPDKSKFYKFHIDVDAHVLTLKKTEVVVNDRKIKTNIGEIELTINAYIELDPEDKWKNNKFLNSFFTIYTKRWKRTDIEDHFVDLLNNVENLRDAIKVYFELPGASNKELFHPKKGHF